MKALSILQPWASLVVSGRKRVETRSWQTLHRGPLAIHAGGRLRAAQRDLCVQAPFHGCLAAAGIRGPRDLPRRCVVGVVTVLDCVPASDVAEALGPCERAFGDFAGGRYAWLLADAVALAVPLPCTGQLGLFELPEAIASALRSCRGLAL